MFLFLKLLMCLFDVPNTEFRTWILLTSHIFVPLVLSLAPLPVSASPQPSSQQFPLVSHIHIYLSLCVYTFYLVFSQILHQDCSFPFLPVPTPTASSPKIHFSFSFRNGIPHNKNGISNFSKTKQYPYFKAGWGHPVGRKGSPKWLKESETAPALTVRCPRTPPHTTVTHMQRS